MSGVAVNGRGKYPNIEEAKKRQGQLVLILNSWRIGRMIELSVEATGEIAESQCCSSKRKIFDDLDVDSFCNEVQTDRKHYLQELETPIELVATSNEIINATALFSPMSAQEAIEESS
ncbi:hypothetical protein PUN28_016668 [Cardiocondyla obscurior]|uniref:Uncharacterized protein n=1 Tax=Cardiocondyla obscurior TaxID=286306 RepID=A0AAW2EQ97_9HYME